MTFIAAGSPPISEHAKHIEERDAWNAETGRRLKKLEDDLVAKVTGFDSKVQKMLRQIYRARALQDEIRKSRAARRARDEIAKRDRNISNLQTQLSRIQHLRKTARWPRLAWHKRWAVDDAERACNRELAKLLAEKKTAERFRAGADATALGAAHRRAMINRGVTFDRMI